MKFSKEVLQKSVLNKFLKTINTDIINKCNKKIIIWRYAD